jgi:hypothetical protein
MGDYERYAGPQHSVNALAGAFICRAPLRLKPSRRWESMGYYERYGGPQHSVNALAGAFVCRAPLRLKPSRRCVEDLTAGDNSVLFSVNK